MYLLLKYSKCTLVLLDPCCWSNQSERDVRWFFPRRTKYKPHPQDITYCMNASSEVMLHSLHVKDNWQKLLVSMSLFGNVIVVPLQGKTFQTIISPFSCSYPNMYFTYIIRAELSYRLL